MIILEWHWAIPRSQNIIISENSFSNFKCFHNMNWIWIVEMENCEDSLGRWDVYTHWKVWWIVHLTKISYIPRINLAKVWWSMFWWIENGDQFFSQTHINLELRVHKLLMKKYFYCDLMWGSYRIVRKKIFCGN